MKILFVWGNRAFIQNTAERWFYQRTCAPCDGAHTYVGMTMKRCSETPQLQTTKPGDPASVKWLEVFPDLADGKGQRSPSSLCSEILLVNWYVS